MHSQTLNRLAAAVTIAALVFCSAGNIILAETAFASPRNQTTEILGKDTKEATGITGIIISVISGQSRLISIALNTQPDETHIAEKRKKRRQAQHPKNI